MKTCTVCKQEKSLDSFGMVTKRGKPYQLPRCKSCSNLARKEYLLNNPDKAKQFAHSESAIRAREVYKERNPDANSKATSAWNKRNPAKHAEYASRKRLVLPTE